MPVKTGIRNYLHSQHCCEDFELERGVMRGLKTKVFVILFLTALTLSENVVVVHAASAQAKTIVSFAGINPRQSPLWIAQEQGFFNKNGVDVDLIFIRTGPIQVAAVSAGSTQLAYAAGASILGAVGSGAYLKLIASFTNRLTDANIPQPSIKLPQELRSKRY